MPDSYTTRRPAIIDGDTARWTTNTGKEIELHLLLPGPPPATTTSRNLPRRRIPHHPLVSNGRSNSRRVHDHRRRRRPQHRVPRNATQLKPIRRGVPESTPRRRLNI